MNYLMIIGMGIAGLLALVLLFKWKEIFSFFYPEDFIDVLILTNNNNIKRPLIWIKGKASFDHDGHTYIVNKKIPYKRGRLSFYIYNEGEQDPIDLRELHIKENPEMLSRIKEITIADLFRMSGINNFLRENMPILLLLIGGVIIFLLWRNGQISIPK